MENREINPELNRFATDPAKFGKEVKDRGAEILHRTRDMASDAAEQVEDRAESVIGVVGEKMSSLASNIRENAPSGKIGDAANSVASSLESGGEYLANRKLSELASDLTDVVKRNPIPSFLLGIGLGVVVARALTRES